MRAGSPYDYRIDEFNLKLFMAYLGGSVPGFSIEGHDVVFVTSNDIAAAAAAAKATWSGKPTSVHVDAIREVTRVGNYRIDLTAAPVASEVSLYFVNLGFYRTDVFNELHHITLVAAPSRGAALKMALEQVSVGAHLQHGDNIYDVDDCIRVAQVAELWIALSPSADTHVDEILRGPSLKALTSEI